MTCGNVLLLHGFLHSALLFVIKCQSSGAADTAAAVPGLLAQRFKQDPQKPAVLYNHDNEYLHYKDDWYIIASKPDSYVVVYYKGSNDAWDGYGGAVVYTRARQLPKVSRLGPII